MENTRYADRYAHFVLRHRLSVIVGLTLFSLLSAWFVKDINLRNDPDSLLPLSNRYISTNLYIEHQYGMGNIMVWGLKVREGDIYQPWFLRLLQDMYAELGQLDFAKDENFIGLPSSKLRHLGLNAEGSLDFKRLMPVNGLSRESGLLAAQVDFLKSGLQKHPVLEPLLVYYEDKDGQPCKLMDANGVITNQSVAMTHDHCTARATFIIGDFDNGLKEDYRDWFSSVNTLMARYEQQYGDRVEFLISGEPYFLASMVDEVWNKAWLFVISLLIILGVLWYQFRHWTCAVVPLVGVGMTIVLTLGLMGFTGFKLTTMMVLTPMLLLAIGIGHAMQVTRRFTQEYQLHGEPEQAAFEAIRRTIVPAALSIGTDLHGFFAISFVDISFYKAYAYFGIYGMATLILTTTTLIPLLMTYWTPCLKDPQDERAWEQRMGRSMARLLTGPLKWLPLAMVVGVLWLSAHYAELGRGFDALMAGEAGRTDPEVARIQDEFDIMPGVEKGINYPRAAFKESYLLGRLFGDGEIRQIHDLEAFSRMMPGAITANLVIRSRDGVLPNCGLDSRDAEGERVIGSDRCFDELDDPPQGIFNDATVLKALAEFEDWMRSHPHIGYSTSYIQFSKTLNLMLNTPEGEPPRRHMNLLAIPDQQHLEANRYAYGDPDDPEYLPEPDDMVQLYNSLLVSSTSPGELDSYVNTTNWDEGVVVAFINTMNPVETHRTVVDIQEYVRQHAADPGMKKLRVGIEAGEKIQVQDETGSRTIITREYPTTEGKASIGGFLGITEATRDVAFAEWLHAPAMTSATVFLMTAIMFRSWSIALVLISLCFITLMTQYGLAGYMTSIKEWSANLAFHVQVALSIAMGLGIDYSVYMVSRLREEMRENNLNWPLALEKTLSSTGSAIIISVVVLLGSMIPLMNTTLANTWSVSLYIAEALILDVLTALLFLPLLIYWLKCKVVFEPYK